MRKKAGTTALIKKAALVEAADFPQEVSEWCIDNNVEVHYQNDVVCIRKDEAEDNPLLNWIKDQGTDPEEFFDGRYYYYVAVIAT